MMEEINRNEKRAKNRFIGAYLLNCLRRTGNDMGARFGKTSAGRCPASNVDEGEQQAGSRAEHGALIFSKLHAEHGTRDGCGQRQNIAQIRAFPHTASRYGDHDTIPDAGTDIIDHTIFLWFAAEHPGQALSTAPAILVTAPTPALLDLDQGAIGIKFTNDGADSSLFPSHDLPPAIWRDIQ
ncbi:MAG TPA: hypothetical protein VF854_00470 [Azonexus sp.]